MSAINFWDLFVPCLIVGLAVLAALAVIGAVILGIFYIVNLIDDRMIAARNRRRR